MNLNSIFKTAIVASVVSLAVGCSSPDPMDNIHYSNVIYSPVDRINGYFDDQYVIFKDLFADFKVDRIAPHEIRINIPNDYGFMVDSAALNRPMRDRIKAMAKTLNQYKETSIWIYGHTDSQGDLAYNLRLSKRRADFIKNLLISNGVDGPRIKTTAEAFEVPRCSNDTRKGRECNRRVELVVKAKSFS